MGLGEIKQAMQRTLENSGIPYEDLRVFGAIRLNVHIRCMSRDTADKWVMVLSQAFKGAKVQVVPSAWDAKGNKGTCLRPTKRKGFLVGVTGL